MDSALLDGTPSTKEIQFHEAEISDLTLCLKHCLEFFSKSNWAEHIQLNEKYVLKLCVDHILSDTSLVLVSEEGIFMGTIVPHPVNPTYYVGQELVWYGKPGKEMLQEFEKWCSEKEVDFIVTSSLVNEREETIRKLYNRYGYTPMEIGYMKSLNKGVS